MTTSPARPNAPSDAPSLTVEEAAQRYEQSGIPRTIRRIQKYCARGDLDCRKLETEFGEKYFITPDSIDRHIAQVRDALAAAGRAPARSVAPERGSEISEKSVLTPDLAPSAQARPDALERDYKMAYLDHLEKENAFLREQNTVLLERVKETNILTGRLQEMLTPLLGGATPSAE